MQVPNPSTNILDYVLFSLVGLLAAAVGAMAYLIRKGTGGGYEAHKTFADDPDRYWDRMRQVVTEPLARVLDRQIDASQELLKEIVRIDERSKLRSEK